MARLKATFKVVRDKDPGGVSRSPTVVFTGFERNREGYWEMPKKLVELLEGYGFEEMESGRWTAPDDCSWSLEESLEDVGDYTDVFIRSKRTHLKTRSKVVFVCEIDNGGVEAEAPRPQDALSKAFMRWGVAGRPIKGICVLSAVQKLLKELKL